MSAEDFTNLRVLLVDDESFVRRVTAKIFNTLKIAQVLEAENGVDAISVLGKHQVDLLITDIQMPEMNGIELIKQVRMGNTPAERGLRTIVVTSFSNTEVLSSCLALDINGFLVKPITTASATDKIRIAISEQRNLHTKEAYHQVKSDLKSLAEIQKKEKTKVTAAILRESGESSVSNGTSTSLRSLKPGMELLEDLHAHNGMKLLTAGRVLDEGMINRILELHEVIDGARVRVK